MKKIIVIILLTVMALSTREAFASIFVDYINDDPLTPTVNERQFVVRDLDLNGVGKIQADNISATIKSAIRFLAGNKKIDFFATDTSTERLKVNIGGASVFKVKANGSVVLNNGTEYEVSNTQLVDSDQNGNFNENLLSFDNLGTGNSILKFTNGNYSLSFEAKTDESTLTFSDTSADAVLVFKDNELRTSSTTNLKVSNTKFVVNSNVIVDAKLIVDSNARLENNGWIEVDSLVVNSGRFEVGGGCVKSDGVKLMFFDATCAKEVPVKVDDVVVDPLLPFAPTQAQIDTFSAGNTNTYITADAALALKTQINQSQPFGRYAIQNFCTGSDTNDDVDCHRIWEDLTLGDHLPVMP